MKQIIDLVDSYEYATTNCFVHQLTKQLNSVSNVRTIALSEIKNCPKPEQIICRLKQRTVHRVLNELNEWANGAPITIFDQDPWEAYKDDSPYKGIYECVAKTLNVKKMAITTKWWTDFMNNRGILTVFTPMWMLPEYCSSNLHYANRDIQIGFIGSVHPYRKQIIDYLKTVNVHVDVIPGNSMSYDRYLTSLRRLRCYVHSENLPFLVDGKECNLNTCMWIKDVEAMSQGCFSLRDTGSLSETYFTDMKTSVIYEDKRQIPSLLEHIQKMDPQERQSLIDSSVEQIRVSDRWQETVNELIS